MAGMFYSLQEVIEKLSKSEEEIIEIVKQGRLREFRDGPNLLFKVDEVEALMSDTSVMASKKPSRLPEEPKDEEEILLVSEPDEKPTKEEDWTDADTALAGEGINILGETDNEYKLADDTRGETKAASEETSLTSSGEPSLEEIEEDVNLDTFGSGSGLLDLSLQADDTSLGGILDEIYTSEGAGEEGAVAAEVPVAMDVAMEAEETFAEEQPGGAQPVLAAERPALVQAYAEPEPDTLSNALGLMLFLPLAAIIYTSIVAIAGFGGVMPIILQKVQGIIWYIMIGAAIASGLVVGAGFMLGGRGGTTTKKPKVKKEKKPKEKKEKTPKEKK